MEATSETCYSLTPSTCSGLHARRLGASHHSEDESMDSEEEYDAGRTLSQLGLAMDSDELCIMWPNWPIDRASCKRWIGQVPPAEWRLLSHS